MSNIIKYFTIILALTVPALGAFADYVRESVVDDGYEIMDGGRYIKSTQSDGRYEQIPYSDSRIQTPCSGRNLPALKTRNARVQNYLSCSGDYKISQERKHRDFSTIPNFKETLASGDKWALYNLLRENVKTTWQYRMPYTTNVNWTWTNHLKGRNGRQCGYNYHPTTCTRTIRVETQRCHWVPDPEPSGGGFGGGGFGGGSGGGGGGGGYDIEHDDPFSYNIKIKDTLDAAIDLLIPKAHAAQECDTDYHNRTETFSCYTRSPRECDWKEEESESFTCSNETMAVELDYVKADKDTWNPDVDGYVPFLPNGNDLLPGEREVSLMKIQISGDLVRTSEPEVRAGIKTEDKPYYNYNHNVQATHFRCEENADNSLKWTVTSNGRQVSKTPNSLRLDILTDSSTPAEQNKTGLYDDKLKATLVRDDNNELILSSMPFALKIADKSAQTLSILNSNIRAHNNAVAGNKAEWKDTFYRLQLFEVFPGRSKDPIRVTETIAETESLLVRKGEIITIPLLGQNLDTDNAFVISTSGLLLPKGFFKATGTTYQMIPNQTYELRVSMLHRGIPFYMSGCANGAVGCEREEPNPEAFSDEMVIPFTYKGTDDRGMFRKYYDYMRRKSPW